MNTIKKVLSLLLVGVMLLSFAACHPKDETALTIGDVKITSALYMYALINADGEAMTKVDEALAEEEEDTSSDTTADTSSTETVDYYSEEIDGKSYTNWVKDRAIEICTEFAAYETLCNENDVTLSEEDQEQIDYYTQYYWSYYGYQLIYETNGVSFDTFKKGFTYSYLFSAYFEHLYGEGGEKEVAADEVAEAMAENFVIADLLEASTTDLEETELAELKTKFNGYVTRLNAGETFEAIYNEYYEIEEEDTVDTEDTASTDSSSDETASDETAEDTEEEEVLEPQDPYASLLGSEETDYADALFDTVKAMTVGEIKLVEDEENETISIVIKGDIMADEYWTENLNMITISLLKMEEFEADVEEYTEGLSVKKNSYAINRFKVKNIDYSSAYTS